MHFWPAVFLPPTSVKLQLECAAGDKVTPFPCFRRTGTPRSQPCWSIRAQLKLVLHGLSLMKVLSHHKYCIFPGCTLVVNQLSAHPFTPDKAQGKQAQRYFFTVVFKASKWSAHPNHTHSTELYHKLSQRAVPSVSNRHNNPALPQLMAVPPSLPRNRLRRSQTTQMSRKSYHC